MTQFQRALAWAGGREHVKREEVQKHSSAALVGLALAVATVLSFLGWRLWLLKAAWSFPDMFALLASLLAGALFRKLAHAGETTSSSVQRFAIEFTAALMLTPGAWMAATQLPPVLFQSRIDTQAVAARVIEAQTASAERKARIEQLNNAFAARQRELERLEPAQLAWKRDVDQARIAADRCENKLRALRQSMPEAPDNMQLTGFFVNLEGRAANCAQLSRNAEQIGGRFDQKLGPQLRAAKIAVEEARVELEHAERGHAAALRAAREAERESQRPCLPVLNCQLQRAIGLGAISNYEAWGATLTMVLLGLLPALLLVIIPPDAFAYDRHMDAAYRSLSRHLAG